MKVVRVHGGHVYHVVHETQTHTRRASAYIICNDSEQGVAEMRDGVPTCTRCVELDNPLKLSAHEKKVIEILAAGHSIGIAKPQSVRRLIQLDIVDFRDKSKLTRRGLILAKDYTEGTAPWWDDAGVSHYRHALEAHALCAQTGPGFPVMPTDKLTVERYDKMRKAGGAVTCFACLALAR
jgi:hypothetical protein